MRNQSLNLLYYPFREKVVAGLEQARDAGIPLQVFETFRSRVRQSELYAKGRTAPGPIVTRALPGQTYHNYGIAVDLVLWIDGKWTWDRQYHDHYREAGKYFELQGLTWLGRNSGDLVHYQYKSPYKIEDLQRLYDEGGLEFVWMKLDGG